MPIAAEIQLYAALLLKFYDRALAVRLQNHGEGINTLQHRVLRMLEPESLTVSEISRRLGLDPSTLVRAVDGLERRDLARRGSDPKDRRRNPITLTEKGRALVQAVPALSAQDPPFRALQALGLGPGARLRELLRALVVQSPEGRSVVELLAGREKR